MDGTVLIADDDRTIRTVLTQAFTRAGCKVHATSSLTTLMRWVGEGKGDLVISDVVMPDGNGLEMLPRIAQLRDGLPVIVISAQNTIMTAIKATEAKAFDYLPKPFDLPDLMKRSSRALAQKRNVTAPTTDSGMQETEDLPLIGRTGAMQALYRLIARVVNGDLPVLIGGESGTGKSLVARAIHDFSDRRSLPFVVVTATDLTSIDGLGRVLTRAAAGTLVFDEISEFPADSQAQIARLMDRLDDTSPRIMATTQADLPARLESGDFRQDLFYRLNGVAMDLPALRDRIEDIPLLVDFFLQKTASGGEAPRRISGEGMKLMQSYSWPGNVRQLENTLKRLSVSTAQPEISLAEVEAALAGQPAMEMSRQTGQGDKLSASIARHLQRYFDLHGGALPPAGLYTRILHEMERPLLEISLEATGGNQAKCADLLGINRNTLRKKINELDIRVTRRRKLM